MAKGLFSGVRVRNFSDFLIFRHFPGANVDEAANSSTKGANIPIQKSGQRQQTSRFKNRDEGSNSSRFKNSDEGCKLPDSKSGRREQKKKFFFFPKASTGSVSLIIAPKVSQDCLNDQADTADHSL